MKKGWEATATKMCSWLPQRYLLSVMAFFAVANAYTMRVCLNVAITVMVRKKDEEEGGGDPNACPAQGNETTSGTDNGGTFDWNEEMQGLILSSFFWGYVITHIPGALLADRFGGKYTLSLGILCTALFTLLTPIAANGGSGWLLAVRLMEGLGEGSTFPAINVLLANWAPPLEKSKLGSLAFSGSLIGTVVGQAVTGVVLHNTNNNWPVVFYLFGGLAVLWFVLFTLLCYNDPQSHPFITKKEKQYLEETILGLNGRGAGPPVPWRAMLVSVPLWGLIGAQIGHDWAFFTMVTDLPKYMNDVLKYNIKSNGYYSALPYLVMFITSIMSGWFADFIIKKKWMSVTNTRKFFTTIASVGPAAGIIGASYAGCNNIAVISLFTVGMGFMGAFYPGMKVNGLDLSPNFAGVVMGVVNGIGAFTGIITPYLVGVLTPNSYLKEWRTVFWIVVAVCLVTNVIFVAMASGDIQPWNAIPVQEEAPEQEQEQKE